METESSLFLFALNDETMVRYLDKDISVKYVLKIITEACGEILLNKKLFHQNLQNADTRFVRIGTWTMSDKLILTTNKQSRVELNDFQQLARVLRATERIDCASRGVLWLYYEFGIQVCLWVDIWQIVDIGGSCLEFCL